MIFGRCLLTSLAVAFSVRGKRLQRDRTMRPGATRDPVGLAAVSASGHGGTQEMKLVFLTWRDLANPSAGGAEVMFDRVLKELMERGHDVTLVCGGPTSKREYRVIAAGGTYSQYFLIPLVCLTRFRRVDVVIDTENGFPYFSPLWRRRPSICAVHHVHTDQWQTRFPKVVAEICRNFETRVMPRVYRNTTFIAISQSTAADLKQIGIDPAHIRVIEPGIDLSLECAPAKAADPLYVSLSRLVPHKRLDLLLEAWDLASAQIPGRLVVAGDGPELANLREMASKIPRTQVIGRVTEEEKIQLLGESWMLVSASHHEGWGLSVLEAATLGTPTLATDAPGLRDAVEDGVTGTLVRAEENELVAALARAWVDLALDEDTRQRMGKAARERSAQFNWQSTIDKWVTVIEEVRYSSPASQRHRNRRRGVVLDNESKSSEISA